MRMNSKISSDSLKRVIIRFDYVGSSPSSILPWVEEGKKDMLSFFEDYIEAECGSMKVDMSHPELVTTTSGLSVTELTRGPLHVFQNGSLYGNKDEIRLEISHFYMALTINCIDYEDGSRYRDLMCSLMDSLVEFDKYVKVTSFGIRKLNMFSFGRPEQLEEALLPTAMAFNPLFDGKGFSKRNFTDRYIIDRQDLDAVIILDYDRKLRFTETKDNECVMQTILDMDAKLVNNGMLRPSFEKLKYASAAINDLLYSCFIESLTKKYISAHEKQ